MQLRSKSLAVRNIPERTDLLPIVKVMPDQSDDAKSDGSQSIDMTSDRDSHHLILNGWHLRAQLESVGSKAAESKGLDE